MSRTVTTLALPLAAWLLLPPAPAAAQVITYLHNFGSTATDGIYPDGSLTLLNGTLFGLTNGGGAANGNGTVFRLGPSGGGYGTMYSFSAGPTDGRGATGTLVAIGSTLYGMTTVGGTAGGGTIFKVNADNTGYTVLHSFAGGPGDGSRPQGALLVVGGTLYGTTGFGGSANDGVVFKMNPDGTGFSVVHSFAGGPNDGKAPTGALVTDGISLYGMSQTGGAANGGTIFRLNPDGSGFGLIHSFGGGANDGQYPSGPLTLEGSTLHGMTPQGGNANGGIIFRVSTDGSNFTATHQFTGVQGDGYNPSGGVTLVGSRLFGMTSTGGSAQLGNLFGIDTDGAAYATLYSFTGFPSDGANPEGDLIYLGDELIGMTQLGGAKGEGTVFSFPISVPEPSSLLLAAGGVAAVFAGRRPIVDRATASGVTL